MALTATAEGVAAQVSINGLEYCFARAEDKSRFTYTDVNGEVMCGNYDHKEERVALGPRLIRLHVLMYPTPERWANILPLIGYTGTPLAPTSSLTTFNAQVSYDSTDVGNYVNGKVDVAIARGQQGLNPVSLELQMVFEDFNLDSAFSGTAETLNAAYEFTAGSLQLSSTAAVSRDFNSFVWVHNNNIRARFNNSVTPTNLAMTQRIMHLGVNTPYTSSEADLVIDAITDASRLTGQDAALTWTRSPQSLAFAFANLKTESGPPSVLRKDAEIRNMQYYKCYSTTANPEVEITSTLS